MQVDICLQYIPIFDSIIYNVHVLDQVYADEKKERVMPKHNTITFARSVENNTIEKMTKETYHSNIIKLINKIDNIEFLKSIYQMSLWYYIHG